MRIITISREFGSGGREIGKRLADILGFDYYDKEILEKVAENSGQDRSYVEKTLSDSGWRKMPLTFRNTFAGTYYDTSSKIQLLLEQKKVIEQIAGLGKDFIIVGRNADFILRDYKPLNIFVCASPETKIKRTLEKAGENEKLTEKEIIKQMKVIDKNRAVTRELLCDKEWGQRDAYGLIINSDGWNIKELSKTVAAFAEAYFARNEN